MAVDYRLMRPAELDADLIERWRTIQRAEPLFASPYFCPEFTQCVGAVRDDARVVVIENDGRVVGFFPFQTGALRTGRPIGGPLSDFHGVIATPDSAWSPNDLLRAAKLPVWAFDHQVGSGRKFEPHVRTRVASPEIDLSAGYGAYVQGRRDAGSDYIPKTEGLARKLARDLGPVKFSLNENTPEAVRTLLEWKSQQYLEAGTTDAFGVVWTRALLERVLASQGAEFAGLCSLLKVDGRIVAGHIGMRSASVFHYWFPTYDPAYAKFSTGIILLLRMAEALAPDGIRKIDLGKGESLYKQRLMTGAIEVAEGDLERASVLAKLRQFRRYAETREQQGGAGSAVQLALRVMRRMERATKLR